MILQWNLVTATPYITTLRDIATECLYTLNVIILLIFSDKTTPRL